MTRASWGGGCGPDSQCYTLKDFGDMAKSFKKRWYAHTMTRGQKEPSVAVEDIEADFWRIVEEQHQRVEVSFCLCFGFGCKRAHGGRRWLRSATILRFRSHKDSMGLGKASSKGGDDVGGGRFFEEACATEP